MSKKTDSVELKTMGATILGFAQACINLNIVAGSEATSLISNIDPTSWYPFERLRDIEHIVLEKYENTAPIMERVGMEMMMSWYKHGPGKNIIKKGVEFLEFQSGSQGYTSVVKGPEKLVGSFQLVELNVEQGRALIHSTTPFDKDLERGVIIGGMTAPGDLDYIDVNNGDDKNHFRIKFY